MANASYSVNGWNFQVTAGIIYFFSDVANISKIKIEGKDEDIEIFKTDGSKVYCQAKTAYNINEANKVASKQLRDALQSLNSHKTQAQYFRYVTNIVNPANVASSRGLYNYNTQYKFSEIPDKDKEKIRRYLDPDFPFEKLWIDIFQFDSDEESREKHAKYIIEKFLASNGIYNFNQHLLMDKYKNLFFNDACNRNIYKTKRDFIWPSIIVALDLNKDSDEIMQLLGSEEEESNISSLYNNFINEKTVDYEFISKYITRYAEFRSKNQNASIINFVHDVYADYLDDYSLIQEEETRALLAKYIIYRILKNKQTISRIKKGANIV